MTLGRMRVPASGCAVARVAAAVAVLVVAGAGGAQRIAYPSVPRGDILMLGGRAHRVPATGPRIAYPRFPDDTRIAPDDFGLDADEEEPTTPAERQRVADRFALAALSQNYRPRPALWRIRDHDSTIYLFGTIHVLPPGFAWRSAAVERAVAESATLIVESIDDAAPSVVTTRTVSLAARVSPGHRAAYMRFAAALPPGAAAQFDTMPTWMAAVAVGYVRDIRAGEVPGPGADDWLEGYFRALGRPVVPIEDGRRVMRRIGAIPKAEQRRMLDAALDTRTQSRAAVRAPLHAWARGEVGPGSPLTVDLDRANGSDALDRALLVERNRVWAGTLAARLRLPGTAFFAAGAGHFIGAGSVLDLLARRGIRVERVD